VVQALSLPVVSIAESVLADGSVVSEDVCTARVLWHGKEHPVRVLVADVTPLLDMALLRGSEVQIAVESGGAVLVKELPD
jgi:predicted aspartyl protease